MTSSPSSIESAWTLAKERFSELGIDAEAAMKKLDTLPVSIHCWQGDDVAGFENPEGSLTGGIQATGNYPGKAKNAQQLRADLEQAISLIPGLTASTCTLCIWNLTRQWRATKLNLNTSANGLNGRRKINWGWTSTPPVSPIR